MSELTQQKVMELLAKLATALGTTTELLWEVLLRQAYVDGITTIIQAVVYIIIVCVLVHYAKAFQNNLGEDESFFISSDPECPNWGVAYLIGIGLFSIISLVHILGNLKTVITCFVNPEFYALNEILKNLI